MAAKLPVNINHVEIAHDIALMGDIDIVAKKHGVTVADLNRLMKSPDFAQVLSEFQAVMIKEVKHYLTSRAKDAVQVVENIMKDEEASPNARLKAAQDMLDRAGLVARKQSDINVRNTYNYITSLSDEELDAMIEEVENGGLQ